MTTLIPVTFYFDFSEPRSFLAARQLVDLQQQLPVSLVLCPVDAAQLVAAAAEPAIVHGPGAARYARHDVRRYAQTLGIAICERPLPPSSGLALRVAHWVTESLPGEALRAVMAIFEAAWEKGLELDAETLRGCLDRAGVPAQSALEFAARVDAFQLLDARAEIAAASGVFATPSVVVGDERFVGFDRFDAIQRHVIATLVQHATAEQLALVVTDMLEELDNDARAQVLQRLLQEEHGEPTREPRLDLHSGRFEAIAAAIRGLQASEVGPHLPAAPISGHIELGFVLTDAAQAPPSGGRLAAMSESQPSRTLVFGPRALTLASLEELRERRPEVLAGALLGPVLAEGGEALIHIASADGERPRVFRVDECGLDADGYVTTYSVSSARVAYLPSPWARDGGVQRAAAHRGAHIIVLGGVEADEVVGVAAAIRCGRWVVTLGEQLGLHDPTGRSVTYPPERDGQPIPVELSWPPTLPEDASVWRAGNTRRTLVNERPVTLGALESGADIGLAVSGNALMVSTAGVKSYLSATRRFEAVRAAAGPVVLVPIHREHMLISEVITHKIQHGLSRCAPDALLLLVNFWPEMDYESLARLRPVMHATCVEHAVPILLVVGAQPVELWHPDTQGGAHRLEPDGEVFSLDVLQSRLADAHRQAIVERLGGRHERYVSMLQELFGRT